MASKNEKAAARWRVGALNKDEIETMQRFGLDHRDYRDDADDEHGFKGDYNQMQKDLQQAFSSDYHANRGLEASALAGDETSRNFSVYGGANAVNVNRSFQHMKDLNKEHGSGEDLTKPENIAGLTMNLVENEREVFNKTIDERVDEKAAGLKSEFMEKLKAQEAAATETIETQKPSDRLTQARQAVKDFEGKQTQSMAQNMLSKHKKQVMDKLTPAQSRSVDGL